MQAVGALAAMPPSLVGGPTIYTTDYYADCSGERDYFSIDGFKAAYYEDISRAEFHLSGDTSLQNESIMVHIEFTAGGETLIDGTYDPCRFSGDGLCPLNEGTPLRTISGSPGHMIPPLGITLVNPDGFARLQIFSNATQSEIGCLQAGVTNGRTMRNPAFAPIFFGVTVCAALASFFTSVGRSASDVLQRRLVYAHTPSALVILDTFQSIFLTGAISLPWPAVLPAWWSNFAWSVGMFNPGHYAEAYLRRHIEAGGASNALGSSKLASITRSKWIAEETYGTSLTPKRPLKISDTAKLGPWGGKLRLPDFPLPGNWPGLSGTLSAVDIPRSVAPRIAIQWYTAPFVIALVSILATAYAWRGLARLGWVKKSRLEHFYKNPFWYACAAAGRILFTQFFGLVFLATLQFKLGGTKAVLATTGVLFTVVMLYLICNSIFSCKRRFRKSKKAIAARQGGIPGDEGPTGGAVRGHSKMHLTGLGVQMADDAPWIASIHADSGHVIKFGWLSARYKRTAWWFFIIHMAYQLMRGCILGAGSEETPAIQIFALFITDTLFYWFCLRVKPFLSQGNTVFGVRIPFVTKVLTHFMCAFMAPGFEASKAGFAIAIMIVQGIQATVTALFALYGLIMLLIPGAPFVGEDPGRPAPAGPQDAGDIELGNLDPTGRQDVPGSAQNESSRAGGHSDASEPAQPQNHPPQAGLSRPPAGYTGGDRTRQDSVGQTRLQRTGSFGIASAVASESQERLVQPGGWTTVAEGTKNPFGDNDRNTFDGSDYDILERDVADAWDKHRMEVGLGHDRL